MKGKIIVAVMALFLTAGISAQTPQKSKTENRKSCYVDENNNGVCDKYEDGTCKVGNGKGLACGKRDGSGRNNRGKGRNFIDNNSNGICDRYENGTCTNNCIGTGIRPLDGTGSQKGSRK